MGPGLRRYDVGDSGSGPSDHPGMTNSKGLLRSSKVDANGRAPHDDAAYRLTLKNSFNKPADSVSPTAEYTSGT